MQYDWDESKRVANFSRHGVDFIAAVDFEWDTAIKTIDDRRIIGKNDALLLVILRDGCTS